MATGTLVVANATEFGDGGTAPTSAVTVSAAGNSVVSFVAPTATDGDEFVNNGVEYLIVKNKTAVDVALTIVAPNPDEYGEIANVVISGIGGATTPFKWHVFGPFSTKHFNSAIGKVKIIFDTNHANLEVAVFKYGRVYE